MQLLYKLNFVICFVNDILVYSRTEEEHIKHLKEVISILTSANLTLNPIKCHFGMKKIHILGHCISNDGVEIDPQTSNLFLEKPITCEILFQNMLTWRNLLMN